MLTIIISSTGVCFLSVDTNIVKRILTCHILKISRCHLHRNPSEIIQIYFNPGMRLRILHLTYILIIFTGFEAVLLCTVSAYIAAWNAHLSEYHRASRCKMHTKALSAIWEEIINYILTACGRRIFAVLKSLRCQKLLHQLCCRNPVGIIFSYIACVHHIACELSCPKKQLRIFCNNSVTALLFSIVFHYIIIVCHIEIIVDLKRLLRLKDRHFQTTIEKTGTRRHLDSLCRFILCDNKVFVKIYIALGIYTVWVDTVRQIGIFGGKFLHRDCILFGGRIGLIIIITIKQRG